MDLGQRNLNIWAEGNSHLRHKKFLVICLQEQDGGTKTRSAVDYVTYFQMSGYQNYCTSGKGYYEYNEYMEIQQEDLEEYLESFLTDTNWDMGKLVLLAHGTKKAYCCFKDYYTKEESIKITMEFIMLKFRNKCLKPLQIIVDACCSQSFVKQLNFENGIFPRKYISSNICVMSSCALNEATMPNQCEQHGVHCRSQLCMKITGEYIKHPNERIQEDYHQKKTLHGLFAEEDGPYSNIGGKFVKIKFCPFVGKYTVFKFKQSEKYFGIVRYFKKGQVTSIYHGQFTLGHKSQSILITGGGILQNQTEYYEGNFKQGKYHGYGYLYNKRSKSSVCGTFVNGRLKSEEVFHEFDEQAQQDNRLTQYDAYKVSKIQNKKNKGVRLTFQRKPSPNYFQQRMTIEYKTPQKQQLPKFYLIYDSIHSQKEKYLLSKAVMSKKIKRIVPKRRLTRYQRMINPFKKSPQLKMKKQKEGQNYQKDLIFQLSVNESGFIQVQFFSPERTRICYSNLRQIPGHQDCKEFIEQLIKNDCLTVVKGYLHEDPTAERPKYSMTISEAAGAEIQLNKVKRHPRNQCRRLKRRVIKVQQNSK